MEGLGEVVYKGLKLIKSTSDGTFFVRSIFNALQSNKTFSGWKRLKSSQEIQKGYHDVWIEKNDLPHEIRGWYINERFVDQLIHWILPTYDLNQDSNNEVKPITFRSQHTYLLYVGIFKKKSYADENQTEINLCKRRRNGFKISEKEEEVTRLIYHENTKEVITELRNDIASEIMSKIHSRIFIKHTQGSRILIPNDMLPIFEEIVTKYSEKLK